MRYERRFPFGPDERGSLLFALLLTLVGMSLSALVVPLVGTQLRSTQTVVHRTAALDAAQAGLDTAAGQIRAAADNQFNGLLEALPCAGPNQPLIGGTGATGTPAYRVELYYLPSRPTGTNIDVLESAAKRDRLSCPLAAPPAYALLISTGTDSVGGTTRRLTATYGFKTSNENIAGGLIHVYRPSTVQPDLCLDAGVSPGPDTAVTVRLCDPAAQRQKFSYNPNLTLSLPSSRLTEDSAGLCLEAAAPVPASAVVTVKFQGCVSLTETTGVPIAQRWSFNGNANFQGTTTGAKLSKYCFNLLNPGFETSTLVLKGCGNSTSTASTFTPDAAVGAGAAGSATGQLVNFKQFGRCVDVANQVPTHSLIAWSCKQNPDPAEADWNQKWTLPPIDTRTNTGTGRITTNDSGAQYCMVSPRSTARGAYVKLVACPGTTTPVNGRWTRYEAQSSYADSYLITDEDGNCLAPSEIDLFPSGITVGMIVVARCDDSYLQKWNAPATIAQPPPLADFREN